MAAEQRPADHLPRILLQQIMHEHHVAEALAHLLPRHVEEAVVHPVAGVLASVRGAGLGDLVGVVGEDQVVAATVDVDRQAQHRLAHSRAFDVPAGTPRQPLRPRPFRLPGLGRLPQDEVGGASLVVRHLHPRPGQKIVQRPARQRAVIAAIHLITRHVEQHLACADIGRLSLDQLFDQGDHLAHVGGGAGRVGGRQGVERRHIRFIDVGEPVGDDRDVHAPARSRRR